MHLCGQIQKYVVMVALFYNAMCINYRESATDMQWLTEFDPGIAEKPSPTYVDVHYQFHKNLVTQEFSFITKIQCA